MKIIDQCVIPLALFLTLAGTMAAQEDPPSRVARLSYITGEVSFEPSTVNEWAPASLNYPLTTGDNLYTNNGARAVLRVGRNSVRLAEGTNFQMVNLSDDVAQMSINSGSIVVRIRSLHQGETWEVDTPNGAVTLQRAGEYRIDSDPDRNATMVTVRNGAADVTSNDQSFPVYEHQTAYLDPNGQPDVRDMNTPDDFDRFGYSRDRIEDAPPPRYVSADVSGYEDLAAYGSWRSSPDYGELWVPRVEAGWAPYQTGHWAWVGPWGWTWVDDAPWGFAPFHYGRWARFNDSWGWVPGPVDIRPVYAPALVAFVGGGGFGVSVGIGAAVGWFALGPREPYYPAYHVSDNYVRQVNVSNTVINNTTIINNYGNNYNKVVYANQRVNGAVMAVPQNTFVSGGAVQHAVVRIAPEQLRAAQVVATAPVAPQRASILAGGNNAGRVVAGPPANILARPVVAKLAPPPAPVQFQAQQRALQQNPGRPVAPQQLQTIRQSAPTAAVAPMRIPIKTVNAAQVHAFTPVPHAGQAPAVNAQQPPNRPVPNQPGQPGRPMVNNPAFNNAPPVPQNGQAQRPAFTPQPQGVPPASVGRPGNIPSPEARPQVVPPVNRPAQDVPNVERPVNPPPSVRPQNVPPPVNRPAQPPVNSERPAVNTPPPARPAYERPQAPPPQVRQEARPEPPPVQRTPPPQVQQAVRPAPPPPQRQEARPAPPPQQRAEPKPAEKPKEEKP